MSFLEIVKYEDTELAYIVKGKWKPEQTTFLTPSDFSLQMGLIVYPAGGVIIPHVHLPVVRMVSGTNEVVMVRQGACDVDIYTNDRVLVGTYALEEGDTILLLGGGHGFRMREDTILFEVKQGPFLDGKDKERF